MPLVKAYRGVLISKNAKSFEDGNTGYFCTILQQDETMLNFWAPSGIKVGEPMEVEGFDFQASCLYYLSVRSGMGKLNIR